MLWHLQDHRIRNLRETNKNPFCRILNTLWKWTCFGHNFWWRFGSNDFFWSKIGDFSRFQPSMVPTVYIYTVSRCWRKRYSQHARCHGSESTVFIALTKVEILFMRKHPRKLAWQWETNDIWLIWRCNILLEIAIFRPVMFVFREYSSHCLLCANLSPMFS